VRTLTLAIALACTVFATLRVRAQAPDPNHTVVRFDVTTEGTNFGSFDIELFDQEKPETVKNFLLYVRSGAYSNLVLHRLEPGFVIQAGHVHIEDPLSTNVFSSFPTLTNFGQITNEYAVGPVLSNVFGTIAMARVPGQTNSANTDWFINLANNLFLDTVDGGFTVFGRIVNTTDDRSGTNLLNQFNTFLLGNNIRSANPGESLNRLPVATNRPGQPVYADLFTAVPSFIQGGMPDDDVPPTVEVTAPVESFISTTNSILTITGTASDNRQIAWVRYDTDSGKSLIANGTTSWSVELPLLYGTNHFTVRSIDSFGHISSPVERVIVRDEIPSDPNHTIVRFDISTNGNHFGTLDIELYDNVKPETVQNFLMYVYSGAYSNLPIYNLRPNQTLAAGHILPDGAKGFSQFSYVPNVNFGRTANEYETGAALRNEVGTIAAYVPAGGNSASNEWQINLGNNAAFDAGQGGGTVFGRVVNTTDERSGINLLKYFNTFQDFVNLRPITQIGPFFVPVTFYSISTFPYTSNMFLIRASVIQGGMPHDNIAPIVQINDPLETGLIVTTNATIPIAGTAGDNQEVARVIYDAPSGSAQLANGKESWSANVDLLPGTNEITVRGVDYFGNVGTARRTIVFSHARRVNFRVTGKGKVAGIADGQDFLVGVNYTISAKPAARQYFLGWQDQNSNFISAARSFTFTMREDLTNLTAVFSKTLLGISNGVYRGVFYSGTNGPLRSGGSISLNVAPNGFFSGRLAPNGASYGISGKFDTNGNTSIAGYRGTDLLVLQISFYSTDTIFGSYYDSHSYSSVGLWHMQKFSAANPTLQAGTYSFLISPTLDTQNAVVQGYGFGYVTVDALGKIKMAGTLGDGMAISQKSALLEGDTWALYDATRNGRETIVAAPVFTSNHVFNADLRWFSADFPGGTNQNARLDGALFVPPSDQMPLFNWTNGVISLSGGGLPAAIFANLEASADGTITIPSNPNNIQFSPPDARGMITGTFTHPATSLTTPLQGSVLQSSNIAAGFFPGSPGNGAFLIRAR
jgi:cyclophilin family peptidyl-prolyl cis-trans isomerase